MFTSVSEGPSFSLILTAYELESNAVPVNPVNVKYYFTSPSTPQIRTYGSQSRNRGIYSQVVADILQENLV
jgi:hypothetical protein